MLPREKNKSKAAGEVNEEHPGFVPRAQRFPIRMPVHYRVSGTTVWNEGTTVNISRTGLLFQAETDLQPQTMIQMRIIFPPDITGEPPANVVCWGPVVRSEPITSLTSQPALAAEILRYRFAHD